MAGAYSGTSLPSRGFLTSIDVVRQQQYSTTANHAGTKRSFSDEVPQHGAADRGQPEDEVSNQIPAGNRPRLLPPPRKLTPGAIIPAKDVNLEQHCIAPDLHVYASEFSQRKAATSTPGPTQNPLLSLAHPKYALPVTLVSNLASLGVHSIYPWQSSCLVRRGLLTGQRNLVYTAPTGGGKSLVAEVCLLKRVIEEPTKKGILVLPYVALVQEKLKWLRSVVDGVEKQFDGSDEPPDLVRCPWHQHRKQIRLAGFFGGSKTKATWSDIDIAVCTIEKANSLVNTAIEEGQIDKLGIIVVDELHMIDDENRGYLIELMITKVLSLQLGAQIIGMSATLSNLELLSTWIRGNFYRSAYRPVPVEEFLVYDNAIYPTVNSKVFFRTASQLTSFTGTQYLPEPARTIQRTDHRELKTPATNAVVSLAVETAAKDYGALVFCSSRQGTQDMAVLISEAMPPKLDQSLLGKRMDILASLQALPNSFEPTLSATIMAGVGFHHRGITTDEGDIICKAFDEGTIKVMVATCSLAAGINLPARRVILNGARMGRDLVGPALLRQMRGRAGRKGKDEIGESYLVCHKADLEAVSELLEADLPPTQSCLTPEKRGMKRAILEVITTRVATTQAAIEDYFRRSLLFHTMLEAQMLSMLSSTIDSLLLDNMVRMTDNFTYLPTPLGSAIVAASLTPEDGLFVHSDLCRAIQSFVMDGEMHIFYLFTPVQTAALPDVSWPIFRAELEALDDSGIRAFTAIGINPAFVNRLVQSGASLPENTEDESNRARIYRRAYSALQLRDICNEIPVHRVSKKYDVPRGHVQNLAQSCHGFAAGMVRFCVRMGWGMLGAVLEHMRDRLRAGARADLLDMAQVTFVKSRMARVLWENGFKSVRALAEAKPDDLVPIMLLARPGKSRLSGEALEKLMEKLKAKAEVLTASASRIWERQQIVDVDE